MRALCVLALLVWACGTAGVAPAPVFPVRQTAVFSSWLDWQRTPWFRTSDLAANGPVYVIIADGDRACVVSAQAWIRVIRDQLHSCETGWRAPRARK
jgi:hypothetical protein